MISLLAKIAFDKGYRVRCNKIISPRGVARKTNISGKPHGKWKRYPKFTIWFNSRASTVKCHHLTAWQKFGNNCVGEEIQIRHLDDNENNFRCENIELGTREDNTDDHYINSILGEWVEQMNAEAKEQCPF